MKITKLSFNGRTSNAAAKSNNIPAPHKIAWHTHVFLFSIDPPFFYTIPSESESVFSVKLITLIIYSWLFQILLLIKCL